ncbi:MAG TPA: hypothetical protein VIK72_13445 [Clostridiaceae bacterium]
MDETKHKPICEIECPEMNVQNIRLQVSDTMRNSGLVYQTRNFVMETSHTSDEETLKLASEYVQFVYVYKGW